MTKNQMDVWIICEYCGEPFLVAKSQSHRRFCSRSCHISWRNGTPAMREAARKRMSRRNGTPEMREASRKRLEKMRQDSTFAEAQSKAAAEALRKVITDMSIPGGFGHPMPIPHRTLLEALGYPEDWADKVIKTGDLRKKMDGLPRFYRVDILHPESKVIIEADGNSHRYTKEYDQRRDEALALLGYKVVRVTNSEVMTNLDAVVGKVNQIIASRAA